MQKKTLIKPRLDKREYRGLLLDNGLRCILVQDDEAQKAACLLNVRVGSEADPKDWCGLAHMLEHAVFLGSVNFPGKGSFDELIHRFQGTIVAETQDLLTQYGFDIEATMFEVAFEQFIDMVYRPLLQSKAVTKERSAVDAEFHQYKNSDEYRLSHVLYSVATHPDHPLSRFSVGNHKTLADKPTSSLDKALKAFHQDYYHAGNSDLILIGTQSLDELEAMLFSQVSNLPKRASIQHSPLPLLSERELAKDIVIKPRENLRTLSLHFPLVFSAELERTKALDIITHLFNLKGPGTLYHALRQHQWITDVNAYTQRLCQTQIELYVECELSLEGRHQERVITESIFQYIDFLSTTSKDEYYKALEHCDTNAYEYYDEQDPLESAIDLMEHFESYPMEDMLRGGYLMQIGDDTRQTVQSILEELTPAKMRRIFIDKEYDTSLFDPLYQVNYDIKASSFARSCATPQGQLNNSPPTPQFYFPPFMHFVPQNYDVIKGATHKAPTRILEDASIEIWGLVDTTYERPKVDTMIYFMHPEVTRSAINESAIMVVVDSLNEACLSLDDQLHLAGAEISFETADYGIIAVISGFSDGHLRIVNALMDVFYQHHIDAAGFIQDKQEWIDQLEDSNDAVPVEQASELLESILSCPSHTTPELLSGMNALTVEGAEEQLRILKQEAYRSVLCHGSLPLKAMKELSALFPTYPCTFTAKDCQSRSESLSRSSVVGHCFTNSHTDLSLALFYQSEGDTYAERASMAMLEKLISPAFFHFARTESEIGYTAECDVLRLASHTGLIFTLQSPHAKLNDLYTKIRCFISEQADDILSTIDPSDFDASKEALANALLEKPSYLSERTAELFDDLIHLRTQFDDIPRLADAVMKLNSDELYNYFRLHLVEYPRIFVCTNASTLLQGMQLHSG